MVEGRRQPGRAGGRTGDRESGAVAVEFALVMPLLLLILFGVIDFGLVMAQKASLANAARSGARYGVVNAYTGSHTCTSVIDQVRDRSQTLGIGAGNVKDVAVTVRRQGSTVCSAAAGMDAPVVLTPPCTNPSGTPANPDTLTVDTSFASRLPVPVPGLGDGVTLETSSAFQCEYYR